MKLKLKRASLHDACKFDDVAAVTDYINSGADLDACDNNTQTPLQLACRFGRVKIIKLLLAAKVDVNKRFGNGGAFPLIMITILNDFKVVNLLIEAGADVNMTDTFYGNTSLHEATDLKIVRRLIQAKANLNIISKDGSTALTLACEKNLNAVAKELVLAGADLTIKNGRWRTAFVEACWKQNVGLIQFLAPLMSDEGLNEYEVPYRNQPIVDKAAQLIAIEQERRHNSRRALFLTLSSAVDRDSLLASLPREMIVKEIAPLLLAIREFQYEAHLKQAEKK